MSYAGDRYTPGVPGRYHRPSLHPDGDCRCSPRDFFPLRSYRAFELCGHCGNLRPVRAFSDDPTRA